MIPKMTFFLFSFSAYPTISRLRITQLDFQNPQQGSTAVVNIIMVVCQRNQNLIKPSVSELTNVSNLLNIVKLSKI